MNILPTPPKLKEITMDFEKAAWKAAGLVLTNVAFKGCAFHLAQAVWRKVQEIGLQEGYTNDSGTHKFIRRLIAFAF